MNLGYRLQQKAMDGLEGCWTHAVGFSGCTLCKVLVGLLYVSGRSYCKRLREFQRKKGKRSNWQKKKGRRGEDQSGHKDWQKKGKGVDKNGHKRLKRVWNVNGKHNWINFLVTNVKTDYFCSQLKVKVIITDWNLRVGCFIFLRIGFIFLRVGLYWQHVNWESQIEKNVLFKVNW